VVLCARIAGPENKGAGGCRAILHYQMGLKKISEQLFWTYREECLCLSRLFVRWSIEKCLPRGVLWLSAE
jgi:hypothetical protein